MSQKHLCLSCKESKSHILSILIFASSVTHRAAFYATLIAPIAGVICHFCLLANFAFCQNRTHYSFWWFLLLPFAQAKKSRPFGFLHILRLFQVQQTELVQFQMQASLIIIQVSQGKALQIIVKGALLNHKNGITKMEKSVLQNANYKRTPHASKLHYQSAYQGFGNDVTHICRIFVQPGDLEKLTERIILCLFLPLFTRTKQASSLHLVVHFVFIATILLFTSPSCVQIRKWMDESS